MMEYGFRSNNCNPNSGHVQNFVYHIEIGLFPKITNNELARRGG